MFNVKKIVVSAVYGTIIKGILADIFLNKKNLGLVDNSNRKIKTTKDYDHLIETTDTQDGENETIKAETSIENTIYNIKKIVDKYSYQVNKLSNFLKQNTEEETTKAIFKFTLENIKYKLDKDGYEQLRTPYRSWKDRNNGIDCDCFSIFIASILKNLNIKHGLRVAAYTEENGFQHVYAFAILKNGTEIILDPVILKYDYEKPFLYKKDYLF